MRYFGEKMLGNRGYAVDLDNDDLFGQIVDKIVTAMGSDLCKMVSATIIAGNICADEASPLNPEHVESIVDFLTQNAGQFNGHLGTVIESNYYVWAVDVDIREALFSELELSISGMMPIIANGGLAWFQRCQSGEVEREALHRYFRFIKELFVLCARQNSAKQQSHDDICQALEDMAQSL